MSNNDLKLLQDYLSRHIPLSSAMGVQVAEVGARRVCLWAPLAPNINHRETVFGGSASAVAILAAWSLLHVSLQREGLVSRVVIQRNTVAYDKPIIGDFQACAELDTGQWQHFLAMLKRRKKARITVTAQLMCGAELVGALQGDFVALGMAASS